MLMKKTEENIQKSQNNLSRYETHLTGITDTEENNV